MLYRLQKRTDGKRIFSFVKEFSNGNEVVESIFHERLTTLGIKGEIVKKPSKKGNSFFLPKKYYSDIFQSKFPSSTPSCPQDLGHDLSIISEAIESLDKMIDQSLQCITRDPPKEGISTETGDVSSAEYIDFGCGANDELFITVANKGTETDSECHQLIGTLR